MKKPFLILVILLLVSMVSMVIISQVYAPDPRIYVDPSSITELQPEMAKTIRPNGDGASTDWTKRTVVLRPNAGGTYTGWTGRVLVLNPNGEGTFRQWTAWTNLQPRLDGNYTGWLPTPGFGKWNDPEDPDGDTTNVYTNYNDRNQTSVLTSPPTQRRGLTINKVRVNIVARQTISGGDEQVQMILCTVLNANVSSFTEASGWNGWTRVPTSPPSGGWLDKEDYPSNYIYTPNSVTVDKIGNFTFDDVPKGIMWSAAPYGSAGVTLRLRTWQNPGGNDTLRIHLYNGTRWQTFSLTQGPPSDVSDPKYAAYRDIDVSTFLNTEAKINATKMAIEKVTSGPADTIYVDYACIRLSGARKPASSGLTVRPTTTYTHYYSDWSTNPITDSAWTWLDIDALQAGVRSVQGGASWSGYLRVTQLYVGISTSQGLYTDWSDWPRPTGPNGGDRDYFTATAGALRQSSALTNHTSETWPITKVRVTAVACNPDMLNVSGREVITGWDSWTRVGNDPWLDKADYNVNYISTSTANARIGNFTFQNVTKGSTWDAVTLRIKTWKSATGPTLNIYLYNGVSWQTFTITPPTAAAPGSYVDTVVTSFLDTEAKINATKMAIEKLGATGTIGVDHACLSLSDREKIQLMVAAPPFEFKANATDSTLPSGWRDWSRLPSGNSGTWLNLADYVAGVGNYIYTSTGGAKIGNFPFLDVPSGITWSAVKLYLKTWQTGGDGSDSISIEVSPDNGGTWSSAYTITPTSTAAPGDYKYVDVSSFLNTEAKINGSQIRLTKVTSGTADTIGVDHAYIYLSGVSYCRVETALTTTYTEYTGEWATNPTTGLAWTWSDIDKLEAGVKSIQSGLWTGEIRVTQLYVRVIEVSKYENWYEPDHNSDADYNSASAGGLNQSSGLQDSGGWTPARVQVTIVARTDVSTDEKVKIMLVIGGKGYTAGSSNTPTTSYSTYSYVWGKNPAWKIGGIEQPWNWTAINSMEAGVQSIQTGTVWTGEIRVTQLYVVVGEAGTYTDWITQETPPAEDTYVSATMGLMQESSALEDVSSPSPSWTIARVRVVIVAKTNVTTDEQVQLILVIGGYAYYGTKYTLTTTYATYTADWGMNPNSGTFWDWAAINSTEAGVLSIQTGTVWTGEIRVTQLYVEVAGPRFSVDVKINENVLGLFGYDFMLQYDTAVLSATAIKISNFFYDLDPYNDPDYFIYKEEIDDTAGYAEVSIVSEVGERNGPGTLATIYFLVDSIGATPLDLCIKELSDSEGKEIHWILGDVDGDRTVDASDLSALGNAYGSKLGDSNWNAACNFNNDDTVDVYDVFDQSKNYGKTYAFDGYFSNI